MFELFEHTADLGLRVRTAEPDTLFAEAGLALFSVIAGDLGEVRLAGERRFSIEGDDREYLFFDWLSELLYAFDTEHWLFVELEVELGPGRLEAVARGEPLDLERHHVEHEVKAITYHLLKVEQDQTGWLAEVILDI